LHVVETGLTPVSESQIAKTTQIIAGPRLAARVSPDKA
jgi:hypothetical protein